MQREWKIFAYMDTAVQTWNDIQAFAYAYMFNRQAETTITSTANIKDNIIIKRTQQECLDYFQEAIDWGITYNKQPIIAVIGLTSTLQTLQWEMLQGYPLQVGARNTNTAYYLDITNEDGTRLLRFWDMQHMERTGLKTMAILADCQQILQEGAMHPGIHTPATQLSDAEIQALTRRIRIMPRYLQWQLKQNPWIKPGMFGNRVMTQTSLVRTWAATQLSATPIPGRKDGLTIGRAFIQTCTKNLPPTYRSYATRRACFRGGYSFCSARSSGLLQRQVLAIDATSMFHTFMPARIPVDFHECKPHVLQAFTRATLRITRQEILDNYDQPFPYAIHAHYHVANLVLKKNSLFQYYGIGLLTESKFAENTVEDHTEAHSDDAKQAADNQMKNDGYKDTCSNGVFAFGHLMYADSADIWLTEIDVWLLNQVYDYTNITAIEGEATWRWRTAPDYITLQSMTLYKTKQDMKRLLAVYQEGTRYTGEISDTIPTGIRVECRKGTMPQKMLADYYQQTVKGKLNAIYGTQAQDLYRPDFIIEPKDAQIHVDISTIPSEGNWPNKQIHTPRVLYTMGMRIAGRSRLHQTIAMQLIWEKLGRHATILSGDTDSLKIALHQCTQQEVLSCLKPLHHAADTLIAKGTRRLHDTMPDQWHDMTGCGHYQIQPCGHDTLAAFHIEHWQKARVSIDTDNQVHVTCATVTQPTGQYTLTQAYQDLISQTTPEYALTHGIGWQVTLNHDICHMFQPTQPLHHDIFNEYVRDYQGHYTRIYQRMAVTSVPISLTLGDLMISENLESIEWIEQIYKRPTRTDPREWSRTHLDYGA